MPDTDIAKQKLQDFIDQMLSIFTNPEASTHVLERDDTEVMVMLVRRFGEQSIISLIKGNLSQSRLVVAFLDKLYETLKSQSRELQRLLQRVFRIVLKIFIPSLQITYDQPLSKRRRIHSQVSKEVHGPMQLPNPVKAEELAALIGHCEKLILITEVESLLKITREKCETGEIDTSVYESFLIPMLTAPTVHVPTSTHRSEH